MKFEVSALNEVAKLAEGALAERYLALIKLALTRGFDERQYDVIAPIPERWLSECDTLPMRCCRRY